MITNIKYKNSFYYADLTKPLDISIPIHSEGVSAWGLKQPIIEPVRSKDWVGDTNQGSPVNFNNIFFNPHAHSTHTECLGHISKTKESLNDTLRSFFFISKLISVKPKKKYNDCVITKHTLSPLISKDDNIDALIIRTLPNLEKKKSQNYTNTNPIYLLEEAARYLSEININHLLIDVPSIDKEDDNGALSSHKAFWNFSGTLRYGSTITELIYVPEKICDGLYLLNLQFIPFQNDASPSRPVLFKLEKNNAL
ncbi:MAG: metal-dependent hydrolase [Flavobacteriales bacterium]|nr:metal-dependent hydrolase [Flavobacteriales bacterium]|tara:strand:+ start:5275 stop:6033 length:759 start_codon:yes stop_codon:yes gene_type:complete